LRPVLIVSQDVFKERSGTVIAMALTSQPQRAKYPLTHELKSGRLPTHSWVKISQIRTLAVERIGKKIGRAAPEELAHIIDGLNEIIRTVLQIGLIWLSHQCRKPPLMRPNPDADF
jgi:mRNA interferase MazF